MKSCLSYMFYQLCFIRSLTEGYKRQDALLLKAPWTSGAKYSVISSISGITVNVLLLRLHLGSLHSCILGYLYFLFFIPVNLSQSEI